MRFLYDAHAVRVRQLYLFFTCASGVCLVVLLFRITNPHLSVVPDALTLTSGIAVGGELKVLDKKTLKRLHDIELLPEIDKQNIFYTLDSLIKAAKLKAL